MKIAFLTPEFPHERIGHSGGIGTSIKHLAIALFALIALLQCIITGEKQIKTNTRKLIEDQFSIELMVKYYFSYIVR